MEGVCQHCGGGGGGATSVLLLLLVVVFVSVLPVVKTVVVSEVMFSVSLKEATDGIMMMIHYSILQRVGMINACGLKPATATLLLLLHERKTKRRTVVPFPPLLSPVF